MCASYFTFLRPLPHETAGLPNLFAFSCVLETSDERITASINDYGGAAITAV